MQKSRPGRLAKELAFLVFLIRSRVAFHVVDDKVSMDPFKKQFDGSLRGEESFKGLTFAMHGQYSITLDSHQQEEVPCSNISLD